MIKLHKYYLLTYYSLPNWIVSLPRLRLNPTTKLPLKLSLRSSCRTQPLSYLDFFTTHPYATINQMNININLQKDIFNYSHRNKTKIRNTGYRVSKSMVRTQETSQDITHKSCKRTEKWRLKWIPMNQSNPFMSYLKV